MVNKKIVDYLKYGLSRGYSLNSLKQTLIKQGQSVTDIDGAIRGMGGKSRMINRKILFFILSIGILLIILGGIFYVAKKQVIKPEQLEAYKKKVLAELQICLEKNSLYDYNCIALFENDESLCPDSPNPDACYFEIGMKKSLATQIPENCDIFYMGGDEEETTRMRNFCRVIIGKDIKKCDNLAESKILYGGDTLACKAVLSEDSNLCDTLSNSSARDSCYVLFFTFNSITKRDDSYCDQIRNVSINDIEEDISFCKEFTSKNKNLCLSGDTPEYNRSKCYIEHDIKMLDITK